MNRCPNSVKGDLTLPKRRPVDFIDLTKIKHGFGRQLLNQRPLKDPAAALFSNVWPWASQRSCVNKGAIMILHAAIGIKAKCNHNFVFIRHQRTQSISRHLASHFLKYV
jgi:hypothetical protein